MPADDDLAGRFTEAGRAPDYTRPERVAVGFAQLLRMAGVEVAVGDVLTYTESLGAIGLTTRDDVYWAGRATLVRDPEEIPIYDRAFETLWEGRRFAYAAEETPEETVTLLLDDDEVEPDDDQHASSDDSESQALRFSRLEVLRDKDFADCSRAELAEIASAMGELRWRSPTQRSRRSVAVRHQRGSVDIQRTMRAAIRSEGEALRLWKRSQGVRTRRIVLLIDISGSMEDYARQLVRFAHVAVTAQQRIEAFTIGTRLTRITRELSSRDPDAALRHAAANVADWSGGTRLGESLREFNDRWGLRGMARGATVVMLSDGWDRGDPAVLAEQMQRLQRVAHRLIWVNPLKHTPGYAPLARGMAAALDYIDDFREGHSLASLGSLAMVLQDQQEIR